MGSTLSSDYHQFAKQLMAWHQNYGRHDLPWQQQSTPYRVWVSEIMLQQTQVKTVIPYYQRFTERFPNILSLAQAHEDEVLSYWAGLGYYARARHLHKCAQIIQDQYSGEFPTSLEALCQLPGIGRSTAGAILSLAMGKVASILDGNVKRILCRMYALPGWPGDTQVLRQLWTFSEQHTPIEHTAIYNQAMMDLGATLCTRRKPACHQCPVQSHCLAWKQQRVSQFPESKPRKPLPVKTTYMLVLINSDGKILLEKRPPIGIWGGLWSLPECSSHADLDEWVIQQFNVDIMNTKQLPEISHVFSHFCLKINPIILNVQPLPSQKVMEKTRQVWYRVERFSTLGLPKPVQQVLTQYIAEGDD